MDWGQNISVRGFDIPWVGCSIYHGWIVGTKYQYLGCSMYHDYWWKCHRNGIRYTMDKGFNIAWVGGSKYHGKEVRYTMSKEFNEPWVGVKIQLIEQASTLTFVRLSGTIENWRRTSRSCITVVRRDKWKNQIPKRAGTTDKSICTGIKYWVCCIKEPCLISNLSIIYFD